MLFWIVMHLNVLMFSPIEEITRNILQFLSFVELFIEISLIIIGLVLLQKKNNK